MRAFSVMAVHSQWLPLNVWPAFKPQTSVRLLRSRSKPRSRTTQRQYKDTHMQERETKPKGLMEITSSQHKLPPETKETKPTRILECPAELGPIARQEWDRIVGELTSLGVLSSFDRGPLAAYCIAYALWIEAIEMVQKHGAMIKSPKGFPIQSPYLSTVNRQAEIMLRIASEFGFTPASRSRIFSYSKSNSLLLDAVNEADDGLTKW
jgi:P27 family predicted phage terminase small subunit